MTVKEVAEYLRVNQRTVYRLAVDRKLPGFKVGTTWRFKRAATDAWIAAQSAADGAVPWVKTQERATTHEAGSQQRHRPRH